MVSERTFFATLEYFSTGISTDFTHGFQLGVRVLGAIKVLALPACRLVFPLVSRNGKFPGKFGVLEFAVSREIYLGIPGIFLTFARISLVLIFIIPT